jgi:hypothetical protein
MQRIDVKLSYAWRVGCALVAGAVLVLFGLVGIVVWYVGDDPGEAPTPNAATTPCSGPFYRTTACTERAFDGRSSYEVTADAAAGWTFAATTTSTAGRGICLELDREHDFVANECSGMDKTTVSLSRKLTPGKYSINVTDLVPSKTPKRTFTLAVTTTAGAPVSKKDERPFPAPILIFPALGAVFLVIPLFLGGEKARIPRWFDANGVMMRNGFLLPWSEYRGIRPIIEVHMKTGSRFDVGVELMFARGTAIVKWQPVVNKDQVFWLIDQLKAGRNPFFG